MVFSIFTELCNQYHNQFKITVITPKRNPVPLAITSPMPHHPQPLATTNLHVVSMDFLSLDIS